MTFFVPHIFYASAIRSHEIWEFIDAYLSMKLLTASWFFHSSLAPTDWEPRIWDEQVLTVWVALVDATVENGCMQMVRGGHRSGKTARHTIGT